MGFTTSCFIRKNSEELKKKLSDMGYYICPCANFEDAVWLDTSKIGGTVHGVGYFDSEIKYTDCTREKELKRFISENPEKIDCGINEELFFAIAALRDDSDINQWFVTEENEPSVNVGLYIPKGSFELCLVDDKYMHQGGVPTHKATVEELIKHFTK